MLTKVEIKNYRGFPSYRMENLAQVNLFVGKNNSGKTALLEGIQFLMTGGDPIVLEQAAERRGELTFIRERGLSSTSVEISHFFFGHQISPISAFSVSGDNGHRIVELSISELDPKLEHSDMRPARDDDTPFEVRISVENRGLPSISNFRLNTGGGVSFYRARRIDTLPQTSKIIGRFVSNESHDSETLANMWDTIIYDAKENDVRDALRLLEPSVESIHPLAGASTSNKSTRRGGFVLGLTDKSRHPLGSFGDGMRRMLALASSLVCSRNSAMFADEIDTGLHYTVMPDMWKLVIERAIASNVQVFATTHSWDCIEGLSLLCQNDPSILDKVSIQKIDHTLNHSIAFNGESVARMERHHIDPR